MKSIAPRIMCEVSEQKIDPMELFEVTSEFSHGAQVFFFGAVRSRNHGRDVVAVGYDAAVPLAEKALLEIGEETLEKWGETLKISIHHRVGKLSVGELSVGIAVSSPHRDEAYQSSRYIIEQIKERVPIWKKEYYMDGESEWLKGHALCQHSEEEAEL